MRHSGDTEQDLKPGLRLAILLNAHNLGFGIGPATTATEAKPPER